MIIYMSNKSFNNDISTTISVKVFANVKFKYYVMLIVNRST